MSILKGSRYEYSTIEFVTNTPDGNGNPIVFYDVNSLGQMTFKPHIYVEGERLDQIAYTYFKNPGYWWLIPEYNPQITDFTNIAPGTYIRIPSV